MAISIQAKEMLQLLLSAILGEYEMSLRIDEIIIVKDWLESDLPDVKPNLLQLRKFMKSHFMEE